MACGLFGKSGHKYSNTRHNVGFHAADALEKRCGEKVDKLKFKALTAAMTLGGGKSIGHEAADHDEFEWAGSAAGGKFL